MCRLLRVVLVCFAYPSLVLSSVGAFILMYVHVQMKSTATMAKDCSSNRAVMAAPTPPHRAWRRTITHPSPLQPFENKQNKQKNEFASQLEKIDGRMTLHPLEPRLRSHVQR